MLYGDNKPSEDAIDRVVGKINKECVEFLFFCITFLIPSCFHSMSSPVFLCPIHKTDTRFFHVHSIDKKGKFSRKRLNEDEGDITYINERNRVFNKKVRFLFPSFPLLVCSSLSSFIRGGRLHQH